MIRFADQLLELTMKLIEWRSTENKIMTHFVMIMDLEKFSFGEIVSRKRKEKEGIHNIKTGLKFKSLSIPPLWI